MQRYEVDSTFVKSIGYDHHEHTLEIETLGSATAPGHIYQYVDVPMFRYTNLVTAHSIGAYFNRYIKTKYTSMEIFEQHEDPADLAFAEAVATKVIDKLYKAIGFIQIQI
jgi:hypothetical protein